MTIRTIATLADDELIEVQVAHCDAELGVPCTGLPNGSDGVGCEAPATLLLISYPAGRFDPERVRVNPSCRPCFRRIAVLAVQAPEDN